MRSPKLIHGLLVFLLIFFFSVYLVPKPQMNVAQLPLKVDNIQPFVFEREQYDLKTSQCAADDFNCLIIEYSEDIKLNPDDAESYYRRGYVYDETGEYNKAIKDYTKAINLDPKDESCFFARAYTYENLEKFDLAIADYTKAVNLNAQYADAYCNRGLLLHDKGLCT